MLQDPKVSINLVTYNGKKFLPDLFESIEDQTFQDFVVRIVDNGSNDGTIDFIRHEYPHYSLLRNFRNLGFAGAHNQAIRLAMDKWDPTSHDRHYILLVNQDTELEPDFLEQLVNEADSNLKAASFGGKLRRIYEEHIHDEQLNEKVKTEIIDSTGLRIYKSRRVVDRGAGEKDVGQHDHETDVFGISGAVVLYRASALEKVKTGKEYLDEDFFMYKEDIDIAWRLQNAGYDSVYVPKAVCYHYRGAYGKEKGGFWQVIRNRMAKSRKINYWSYRNHWYVIVKNDRLVNFLLHSPFIFLYELKKFLYILFLEQKTLMSILECLNQTPKMLAKRFKAAKTWTRTAGELRKRFE